MDRGDPHFDEMAFGHLCCLSGLSAAFTMLVVMILI